MKFSRLRELASIRNRGRNPSILSKSFHSIFLSIEILHSTSRPPNFRSIEVLIHLIFGIFRVSSFEVNREGRELLLNYLNRDRFSQKGVPSRAERRDSSLCFSFFFFPLSLSLCLSSSRVSRLNRARYTKRITMAPSQQG